MSILLIFAPSSPGTAHSPLYLTLRLSQSLGSANECLIMPFSISPCHSFLIIPPWSRPSLGSLVTMKSTSPHSSAPRM